VFEFCNEPHKRASRYTSSVSLQLPPSPQGEGIFADNFCKAKASGLSRWPVVLGF
jgi:hypothetical protein